MNYLNCCLKGFAALALACPISAQPVLAEDALGQPSMLGSICTKVITANKAAAGVLCGVTVGVPVNIARSIKSESVRMHRQMTEDVTGGDDKPTFGARAVSTSVAIPYGIVSGFVKGSVQGVERGFGLGRRKPFSKESMSLCDEN